MKDAAKSKSISSWYAPDVRPPVCPENQAGVLSGPRSACRRVRRSAFLARFSAALASAAVKQRQPSGADHRRDRDQRKPQHDEADDHCAAAQELYHVSYRRSERQRPLGVTAEVTRSPFPARLCAAHNPEVGRSRALGRWSCRASSVGCIVGIGRVPLALHEPSPHVRWVIGDRSRAELEVPRSVPCRLASALIRQAANRPRLRRRPRA
jgi:hypothetical protein